MGYADSGTQIWSSYATTACTAASRLYCFGIDYNNPLVAPTGTGRIAFVSSAAFISGTGLAGADTVCQNNATAAGLTGTFKALLATNGATAASRFATGEPWVRLDGVAVVDAWTDLAANMLLAPINVQADGTTYLGNYGLWLGAAGFATAGSAATTCNSWASSAGADTASAGTVARSYYGSTTARGCDSTGYRVYCLEE